MTSFIARVEQFARAQPQAIALSYHGGSLTYGTLWRQAEAAAARLHEHGVRAGETVALSLGEREKDWLPALILIYALGWLGAVVLPLHPEAPLASRTRLLERFRARWLISSLMAQDAAAGATVLDPATLDWSGAHAAGAPRGDQPERPFLYVFTSGSTGDPRICLLSFGLLTAQRLQYCAEIGTTAADRLAGPLHWPGKVGLRSMLRMHAVGGAFCNVPFPETLQELSVLIREFGLTQLLCSPWQLRRLLASGAALEAGLAPLRALQIGGAFLAPEEIQAARERITPNVYAVYAATELGVLAHIRPGDPPGTAGHAGRLLPMVEGQAVDEEHRVLPPGSAGRLRFRTPSMPQGYADNPQATAQCFRDGWFYPGELGSIDAAGNLSLHGRADDLINFAGSKIAPEPTEALLAQHPDIADIAVVGVPQADVGEYPVAFAVFRRVPGADELIAFCAQRMDRSHIPVEFVLVDRIPRNAAGKIVRAELLEAYFAARRAQPPAA